VPHGPLGYLTVWDTGHPQPLVSTTNSVDGRVKSNGAVVPAGVGGAISIFATNTTDVVLDINGYFVYADANPSALAFFPITPCRVADTRSGSGPLGPPAFSTAETRTMPVLSSPCPIPGTARAYSLNMTVVPTGGQPFGFLTTWKTGQARPNVTSVNATTGTPTANAAIVEAGTAGAIDVFTSNAADLVIDIDGYFAPMTTGGLSLYNISPCRIHDTRQPTGTPPFVGQLNIQVSNTYCGVPLASTAGVLSVVVVPAEPMGFLTLWEQGQTQPLASTLNAVDAAVTSNLAIVPMSNGLIGSFASNHTQLALDVFGFFAP